MDWKNRLYFGDNLDIPFHGTREATGRNGGERDVARVRAAHAYVEAVKKPPEQEKHFTQSRKGPEGAKKTKRLFFASLCALASLREIVYFFTASWQWVPRPRGLKGNPRLNVYCSYDDTSSPKWQF